MKVLIDVNLSPRWASYLRESGMDAVHWSELGKNDAPDLEIITFARTSRSIILTRDLDFGSHMAVSRQTKPSVVQIRSECATPERIGASVIDALRRLEVDLDHGAIITIDPNRTRMRLLPFRSDPKA